jgi:hypothetical protein
LVWNGWTANLDVSACLSCGCTLPAVLPPSDPCYNPIPICESRDTNIFVEGAGAVIDYGEEIFCINCPACCWTNPCDCEGDTLDCADSVAQKTSEIITDDVNYCPTSGQTLIRSAMLSQLGFAVYTTTKSCPVSAGLCTERSGKAVIISNKSKATYKLERQLYVDWPGLPCKKVDTRTKCGGTRTSTIVVLLPGDGHCEEYSYPCGYLCP